MKRIFQRRTIVMLAVTVLATAAAAQAQNPRADRLREELERRFAEQVRATLALTDEQAPRVNSILSTFAERRRAAEADERRFRMGLGRQLRPGIAADPDSVTLFVDGITAARVRYATLMQEEMTALGQLLTPVQRGQFFVLRDRILQRVQEVREQRRPPQRAP